MKSKFYEPYKYWDPFIERENPPDEEDSGEKAYSEADR